jgi:hypothetical protein
MDLIKSVGEIDMTKVGLIDCGGDGDGSCTSWDRCSISSLDSDKIWLSDDGELLRNDDLEGTVEFLGELFVRNKALALGPRFLSSENDEDEVKQTNSPFENKILRSLAAVQSDERKKELQKIYDLLVKKLGEDHIGELRETAMALDAVDEDETVIAVCLFRVHEKVFCLGLYGENDWKIA